MTLDWFGTVRSFSDSRVSGITIAERRVRVRRVFYAWFVLSLCVTAVHAAPRYNIIALDVLPGGVDSYATGISETGVVVGHSTRKGIGYVGDSRPVIWNQTGQPTELWPDSEFNAVGAIPSAINSAGQVVGVYGDPSDPSSPIPFPGPGLRGGRLFIWDAANGMRDLESLGGEVAAINEAGQVAGTAGFTEVAEVEEGVFQESIIPHPFIWSEERGFHDLGSLGGNGGFATDMNNLGQVVGYAELPSGSNRAFIWDEAGGMRELETVGYRSQALAINDHGQVLGREVELGSSRAVIWDSVNGVETIPIWGLDINNLGQVLGVDAAGDLAIWDQTIGIQYFSDLLPADANWEIEAAFALNDASEIVGYGHFKGSVRGFLMTPVPESSTFMLFISALSSFSMLLRFRADEIL